MYADRELRAQAEARDPLFFFFMTLQHRLE